MNTGFRTSGGYCFQPFMQCVSLLVYFAVLSTCQSPMIMVREKIDFDGQLAQAEQAAARSLKILQDNGFVVDTSEWLTVKRYAERYGLTTQVVTNWMARSIIPADCMMTLPELNNLRLIKNQLYR